MRCIRVLANRLPHKFARWRRSHITPSRSTMTSRFVGWCEFVRSVAWLRSLQLTSDSRPVQPYVTYRRVNRFATPAHVTRLDVRGIKAADRHIPPVLFPTFHSGMYYSRLYRRRLDFGGLASQRRSGNFTIPPSRASAKVCSLSMSVALDVRFR